jgi:signal transduction histidine kinase
MKTEAMPEREQTDESLRIEREQTDQALTEAQQAIDEDADSVVQHAREMADSVLVVAREKADEEAEVKEPQGIPSAAIAEERMIEDEVLREERASADESVRLQREASAVVLARHLPFERDATDKHLLTERARSDDALATRDDFLGMVCHDLRDLLNGIVVSSAMLAEKIEAQDNGSRSLADTTRIQRYAERMNRLIGDLVDVASIDSGKLSVTPARGDAASLLGEAVDALLISATAKNLSLEIVPIDLQGTNASLSADFDHDRMLQVLANLISNAIKFTPNGGSIRLSCERVGVTELSFCVSDSGQGIPADMLEAVFERFWQVGKNDRRGLGLGLYISRCIVEAHGGTIRAESTLGEGSRIFFTLPVTASR